VRGKHAREFQLCGETTNILQLQVAEVSISFAWPGVSSRPFAAPTSHPPAILEAYAEHRRGLAHVLDRSGHRYAQMRVGVLGFLKSCRGFGFTDMFTKL